MILRRIALDQCVSQFASSSLILLWLTAAVTSPDQLPNHVFYYFLPKFHSFTQQSFSLFVLVFFSYHCSFDFHHVGISLEIGFDIQCKHSFSGEQQSNNTNGCHLCIWTVVSHFNGCSGVTASHNISKGDRLLRRVYKHHLKE